MSRQERTLLKNGQQVAMLEWGNRAFVSPSSGWLSGESSLRWVCVRFIWRLDGDGSVSLILSAPLPLSVLHSIKAFLRKVVRIRWIIIVLHEPNRFTTSAQMFWGQMVTWRKSNSEWRFLFSSSDTARSPVSPKTSLKVRLGTFEKGWIDTFEESSISVLIIFVTPQMSYTLRSAMPSVFSSVRHSPSFRSASTSALSPCNTFSCLLNVHLSLSLAV